jgi:hypothetical protein
MMVVTRQNAIMVNVADQSTMGSLSINPAEITTCVKAFDELPDMFFFGIKNEQGNLFAFKILTQTNTIIQMNAHQNEITDFEY